MAAIKRVTSASGGCIGCDAPDDGEGPYGVVALCPSCWGRLTPVLQIRLKTLPGPGVNARLRYGGATAEAFAYLRNAPLAELPPS